MAATAFDLGGRHVAIVGGVGLIGAAIARCVIASGGRATVLDLAPPAAPDGVGFVQFDCTRFDQPSHTLDAIEAEAGTIDAWVNTSYPRTADYGTPAAERADAVESWRANVDLHMNSSCVWATAMAERMHRRGGGAIVSTSSVYGLVAQGEGLYDGLPMNACAVYAAMKGAIIAHTRFLASRFSPTVRANVICPGGVARNQHPTFVERYGQRTMAGRLSTPEEVAWPVVFLLSDAASYITATVLPVDGGFSAW